MDRSKGNDEKPESRPEYHETVTQATNKCIKKFENCLGPKNIIRKDKTGSFQWYIFFFIIKKGI